MERMNLPIPADLRDAVDAARGDIPRTVWIRRAIEAALPAGAGRGAQRALGQASPTKERAPHV